MMRSTNKVEFKKKGNYLNILFANVHPLIQIRSILFNILC
jgi:hypothetical protein